MSYLKFPKYNILQRLYSNISNKFVLEPLKERSLIKITGQDTSEFLQGLITNDINHLSQNGGSMYSMFLNTKGRVLFDTIIYKNEKSADYLIECDSNGIDGLIKHLKMFKLRRKVEVINVNNEFSLYVLFGCNESKIDFGNLKEKLKLEVYKDPRVAELGFRLITNANINDLSCELPVENSNTEHNYKTLRYSLGVGEGFRDFPPGNCFPLESNCDYLHGVSFHKGCYLGQELTARTHHTGVVRKRLMPMFFTKIPTKLPKDDTVIHEEENLGKLRGIEGNFGLGLLRINKVLNFEEINVGNGIAKVKKPTWWPVEVPKEKINLQKS